MSFLSKLFYGAHGNGKIAHTNPMYTPTQSQRVKNKRRRAHLRRIGKLK